MKEKMYYEVACLQTRSQGIDLEDEKARRRNPRQHHANF
jgi:hypothetical protein